MARHQFSTNLTVSVVCGDHGRAQHICNILQNQQLDARSGEFADPSDIFLFDLNSCRPALIEDIVGYAQDCKVSHPLIATLGQFPCGSPAPDNIDIRLSTDNALYLARSRFHFAHRTAARRAEVRLRRESYERYGLNSAPDAKHHNKDILYVGEASREFLSLKDHLESQGFNLTASFSAYTAFDYLHDHSFGAVILDTTAENLKGDNFCGMIRRSPNLSEIPLLAITHEDLSPSEDIFESATDLIDTTATEETVANLLNELVVNRGPSAKDFAAPSDAVTDKVTGLFTRQFFEDHLNAQVEWSLDYGQPLSVLVLTVLGHTDGPPDVCDLTYTARVVKTLLRVQDAPTRLDESTLAISMPGSSKEDAMIAVRRIEGVLDATAFESRPGQPNRQVMIKWSIAELNADQSSDQLLSQAISQDKNSNRFAAA